ncbi:MAG: permease [Halieaceae bacterium]|nr:permease [Halieaceae bacterium]
MQRVVIRLLALRAGIGKTWRFLGAPVLFSVVIFAALLLLTPEQASRSAIFTLEAVLNILPFILLSVGIAAALKASNADQMVARAFAGRPVKAIALASVFGALSPFCSCGVIPLVAGLLAAGVPIAPVLAFCIASPIMDPEMFVLTAAGLGMEFALVKTFAAVVMGLFTGYLTLLISKSGALDGSLKAIAKPSCSAVKCTNKSVDTRPVWRFWRQADRLRTFWNETGNAGWFLGRWLAFAFVLESLMIAYLPGETVIAWLGDGNPLAIPLAVIVGVPAYLNGYAAIPLVSGLIDLGMSPATGLSFMLAGSVTSIPAAIAVWTIARPRLFGLYLIMAASGALLSGLAYSSWIEIV